MRYVQYYYKNKDRWEEVCGDRGVVILDSRNSLETSKQDATSFNGWRRPKYDGFKLFQGRSFLDSQPITEIIQL